MEKDISWKGSKLSDLSYLIRPLGRKKTESSPKPHEK
jgi:hypothetical protein